MSCSSQFTQIMTEVNERSDDQKVVEECLEPQSEPQPEPQPQSQPQPQPQPQSLPEIVIEADAVLQPDAVVEKEKGQDEVRRLEPSGYLGLDLLVHQHVHKMIRKGICFNLMVVGETGSGKSTLIETLLKTTINGSYPQTHGCESVHLQEDHQQLREKNVTVNFNLIESKGFGDQIIKEHCYGNIVQYIESQYEKYLEEEVKVNRVHDLSASDTRVHCCLYLISPYGHGLRSIDLVSMKSLGSKVNLIPIIAKADTVTKTELIKLKAKIMGALDVHEVTLYRFPTDDDPEVDTINAEIKGKLPFAVVAGNQWHEVEGQQRRGRPYPWGFVEVDNETHSDFGTLRRAIFGVNMEHLRQYTHSSLYEMYKRTRLEKLGFDNLIDLQETFETKRDAFLVQFNENEEKAREKFKCLEDEKGRDLVEIENLIKSRFDVLAKEQAEEEKRLQMEMERLEAEVKEFNIRKKVTLNQQQPDNKGRTQRTMSMRSVSSTARRVFTSAAKNKPSK